MGIFDDGKSDSTGNAHDIVRGVDSSQLHDAVIGAVQRGWLLSFGASRDGFAVSVTVIVDKDKSRAWCESPEQLEEALSRVLTAATDLGGEEPPPIKTKRQPRK